MSTATAVLLLLLAKLAVATVEDGAGLTAMMGQPSSKANCLLQSVVSKKTTSIQTYDQSMEHCQEVADQFRNTCNPRVATEHVDNMASEVVECENWPTKKPCIGRNEGNKCVWDRKLCVTCFSDVDGITKIRVQTNNMPDHCPGNTLVKPQNFDYEVIFNAKQHPEALVNYFADQFDLDSGVCPIHHDFNTDSLRMIEHGTIESTRTLAFAINGVAFQNANQKNQDPVKPIDETNEQPLDICLGHNQRNSDSGMYHYHDFSPCLNKNFLEGKTMGECISNDECEKDTVKWALSGYTNPPWNQKKVIGLAKDGHVLYGPYKEVGDLWHPTDVDACNGAWSDDQEDFFYVATQWHPYVSGCQGPTNLPHQELYIYPQCSLNGIDQYYEHDDNPANPVPSPACMDDGGSCDFPEDCCSGLCRRNRCRNNPSPTPSLTPAPTLPPAPTPAPTLPPTSAPTVPLTPPPTAAPTLPPTPPLCEDSTSWKFTTRKGVERDCSWVAKNPSRCSKADDNGITATEACRVSCNTC